MLTFLISAYLFVGFFILIACVYGFYTAKESGMLTKDELIETTTTEFWVYTVLNCLFVDPALLIVSGVGKVLNGHKE